MNSREETEMQKGMKSNNDGKCEGKNKHWLYKIMIMSNVWGTQFSTKMLVKNSM